MRTPRIFVDAALACSQKVTITGQAAHHISRVLRLQESDAIHLFNNSDTEYPARITQISRQSVHVDIADHHLHIDRISPIGITLVQAITRREKMDFIIQKATELGAARILPVLSVRSVAKINKDNTQKKLDHWNNIMINACEQCGRTRLVDIHAPMPLEQAIDCVSKTTTVYFEPSSESRLSSLNRPSHVSMIIGPEGGFAPEEIELFKQHGCQGIHFGPRILRSETAAISAMTAAGVLWGDLG